VPELAGILPGSATLWSETWRAPEDWLGRIRETIAATGAVVLAGGEFDRWDLEARGGMLGSSRLRLAIEEHGGGRQLLRLRSWPRFSRLGVLLAILLGLLADAAADDRAWAAVVTLGVCALLLTSQIWVESASAMAALRTAVRKVGQAAAAGEAPGKPAPEGFLTPKALDVMGLPASD
jgi:hypothetical protein